MNWWYMAQTSLPDSREVAILCRVLGVSENEAPEKQARKHAWLFLSRLNGQAEAIAGAAGLNKQEKGGAE